MPQLPVDDNNEKIQLAPTGIALAVTVDTTVSTSTEITLNVLTRFLRIYATTQDVFFKWGTADVTSSNFDEVIPAGQIVDLVVPRLAGTSGYQTAVNLIERTSAAAIVVIEKA